MAVTKLTLSIDRHTVENGKDYAQRTGRSLSAIVADYLDSLETAAGPSPTLSENVKELMGIGAGPADERDYRRHLETRQ